MKGKTLLASLLVLASVLAGCRKESADSQFSLKYFGVTQIGPNLTVLLSPYYNNGVPSSFEITGITADDQAYDNSRSEFSIDAQSGIITVSGKASTVPGTYRVSVRCEVSCVSREFPKALEVQFMKGVPDGIRLSVPEATVDINDLQAASAAEIPSPVVTTDGDHVNISSYNILGVRFDQTPVDNVTTPHFSISEDGVVTIVKGAPFKVGTYAVDLKLNTACYGADSQEGIFANAFTLNVVSAPQSLSYTPSSGVIEEEQSEGVKTSHTSAAPVMVGSQEDVVWSIAAVTPACDKIAIDPATGVISIAEGHGLARGTTFLVDVNVKNKWSKDDGLTVPSAYAIEVVEFIYPIEGYSYPASSKKFATGWTIAPAPETKYVRSYAFAEPEADYVQYLTLDAITGELTVAKGNQMPEGSYEVKIAASNGKQEPVVATLALEIVENPYYFTYFAYGNNLGLSEEQTSGASQFRVASAAELTDLKASVKYTDLADVSNASWKVSSKNQLSGTAVSSSGEITFSGYKAAQCGVTFVTATTLDPDDADNSFSVTMPVFVDMPSALAGTTVVANPFVIRVNPKTGGRSAKLEHPGVDEDKFIIDYRRTFNYWNLEGVRSDGTPHESGTLNTNADNAQYFLQNIWKAHQKATGISSGFGAKAPISYYSNTSVAKTASQLDATPAYVDLAPGENRLTVKVNPGLWYDDGWADGVFMAQMTYVVDGDDSKINNGNQRFPVAIWLDKDFGE